MQPLLKPICSHTEEVTIRFSFGFATFKSFQSTRSYQKTSDMAITISDFRESIWLVLFTPELVPCFALQFVGLEGYNNTSVCPPCPRQMMLQSSEMPKKGEQKDWKGTIKRSKQIRKRIEKRSKKRSLFPPCLSCKPRESFRVQRWVQEPWQMRKTKELVDWREHTNVRTPKGLLLNVAKRCFGNVVSTLSYVVKRWDNMDKEVLEHPPLVKQLQSDCSILTCPGAL